MNTLCQSNLQEKGTYVPTQRSFVSVGDSVNIAPHILRFAVQNM